MDRSGKTPTGAVRGALALLLIVCLVECATGSCLSYGHSCWGAHGKRSGPPASSEWYMARLLRRMASSEENAKQPRTDGELAAIFQAGASDDAKDVYKTTDDEAPPADLELKRRPEGIPMLDDDYITNTKFWQLMQRAAAAGEK